MKNHKIENEFFLEPENFEFLAEFMPSILLYECINPANSDFYIKPLKTKISEDEEYLIELKLFNINFK